MARNSIVPDPNVRIDPHPFGDSARGAYVLVQALNWAGFDALPTIPDLRAPRTDRDGEVWSFGSLDAPLQRARYSEVMDCQAALVGSEFGSDTHIAVLERIRTLAPLELPSMIGIEATVVTRDASGNDVFVAGFVNDMGMNIMGCPLPHAGFGVAGTGDSPARAHIDHAVRSMLISQLGLTATAAMQARVMPHSVYVLPRRLRTQISTLVDLRGVDGVEVRAVTEGLQGLPEAARRFHHAEFRPWTTDALIDYSGGHSFDVTKQNLTGVFLSAAAARLLPRDLVDRYIGRRSAEIDLELARSPQVRSMVAAVLHRGQDLQPHRDGANPWNL